MLQLGQGFIQWGVGESSPPPTPKDREKEEKRERRDHQMITQGCLHLAAFLVSRLNTEKSQMKLSNHFLSMEKGDRKVLLLHLEEVDGVVFSMSLSPSLKDVIQFLTEEFMQGWQYSTINSYRSALSAIHFLQLTVARWGATLLYDNCCRDVQPKTPCS